MAASASAVLTWKDLILQLAPHLVALVVALGKIVIQLAPYIVALGGLIVGYLGYKMGKTAAYREKIYSRKLEVYELIIAACLDLYHSLSDFLLLPKSEHHDASWPKTLAPKFDNFSASYRKSALYLSKRFTDAIDNYTKSFQDIHNSWRSQFAADKSVDCEALSKQLLNAFEELLRAARKDIGAETLDFEIKKLIGKTPEKLQKQSDHLEEGRGG